MRKFIAYYQVSTARQGKSGLRRRLSRATCKSARARLVYRARFINGERIDIVPPDSLATGLRAINGSVEEVLPDIERLWHEFLINGREVG